jgi:hypothetical protein
MSATQETRQEVSSNSGRYWDGAYVDLLKSSPRRRTVLCVVKEGYVNILTA